MSMCVFSLLFSNYYLYIKVVQYNIFYIISISFPTSFMHVMVAGFIMHYDLNEKKKNIIECFSMVWYFT